jgi:ubiquinone/menaquinone biosynthesis C-methylase UbiE
MKGINLEDVAKKYNRLDKIWDDNDKWHLWTKSAIDRFVKKSLDHVGGCKGLRILNAGSAGYSYNIPEENILHVDIARDKIAHLPNSIVADIHNLPLREVDFDLILCVGSVINYCDPVQVVQEFERVSKKGGYLILEFENSFTLELVGTRDFNKRVVLVKSFHNGEPEKLWYFSENYIKELAKLAGYRIVLVDRIHILSPLIYRITHNETTAAMFARWDGFCSRIPLVRQFSSNSMFLLFKEK